MKAKPSPQAGAGFVFRERRAGGAFSKSPAKAVPADLEDRYAKMSHDELATEYTTVNLLGKDHHARKIRLAALQREFIRRKPPKGDSQTRQFELLAFHAMPTFLAAAGEDLFRVALESAANKMELGKNQDAKSLVSAALQYWRAMLRNKARRKRSSNEARANIRHAVSGE